MVADANWTTVISGKEMRRMMETLFDKALALQADGHLQEAAETYRIALPHAPDDPRLLSNYGGVLCSLGRFDDAHSLLRHAVTVDPSFAAGWCNLGNCFLKLQRYGEAIGAYRNCLGIYPTHALAISNLGFALDCCGENALARNFHQLALQLDPDNVQTRMNNATSLLALGDYANGFREYECRWVPSGTSNAPMARPQWAGEILPDRTLLIHLDGGFGDMIQFVRFVPDAERRCGRVIVRVKTELLSLLQRSFPDTVFMSEDEAVPEHDVHCPVMSLPYAVGATLDALPGADGYLCADPDKVARWREIVQRDIETQDIPDRSVLRIGLVWAGAPHRDVPEVALADQRRSTDLATLAPLAAALPGALFYSLQIGERADQTRTPPPGMNLIDHTTALRDFDETAALVSALDVIVAVDTSTAHLAAALGKPTLMLSRFDQCWRWLSRRMDSPWYATLRIYQQTEPFDWHDPIRRLCDDLRLFAAGRKESICQDGTRLP